MSNDGCDLLDRRYNDLPENKNKIESQVSAIISLGSE